MKPGVRAALPGNARGPLRVCHENHGANRRDGSAQDAFNHPVGCLSVAPPIVGIYNQLPKSRNFPLFTVHCRLARVAVCQIILTLINRAASCSTRAMISAIIVSRSISFGPSRSVE